MSYQVIARKWRPQTFEEVTGQENITRTLRNAIEHGRLHHAYLFSGARGVGKTTTARLLAKALNCHKTDGPNLIPCRPDDASACASCIEISESRSLDVLEIDAASHTGIGDVRETILEGININPARDRFKVFIIDEVHQLSKPAFNALLKTLEEPPPNVIFVMATTELQKVPETILSRCQEFEFRTIAVQKIFDRLKNIADAEKIDISDDALKEIARSGEGSMRDAQSNLDQVISFSGESISVADVSNALGMADSKMLGEVLRLISARDSRNILVLIEDLTSRGQDLRGFCRDLLSLIRDILVYKVSGGEKKLCETASLEISELESLAALFSGSDLIRFFNSLSETETKLKDAVQSRYVIEIGLMQLVEMRGLIDLSVLLERLSRLESGQSAAAELSSADTSEKKTLKSSVIETTASFAHENIEEATKESALPHKIDHPRSLTNAYPAVARSTKGPLYFVDPTRLEHIKDKWLDNAYEQKLLGAGEDLKPIPNISDLLADLIDIYESEPEIPKIMVRGVNGTAAVMCEDVKPHQEIVAKDVPVKSLSAPPESASESELLEYASNDAVISTAVRIFKGNIVKVVRES